MRSATGSYQISIENGLEMITLTKDFGGKIVTFDPTLFDAKPVKKGNRFLSPAHVLIFNELRGVKLDINKVQQEAENYYRGHILCDTLEYLAVEGGLLIVGSSEELFIPDEDFTIKRLSGNNSKSVEVLSYQLMIRDHFRGISKTHLKQIQNNAREAHQEGMELSSVESFDMIISVHNKTYEELLEDDNCLSYLESVENEDIHLYHMDIIDDLIDDEEDVDEETGTLIDKTSWMEINYILVDGVKKTIIQWMLCGRDITEYNAKTVSEILGCSYREARSQLELANQYKFQY